VETVELRAARRCLRRAAGESSTSRCPGMIQGMRVL
jgi:hypothetical protein